MSPLVKVCGLTRPADAVACRRAGVDWLGLVFAPGPRRVTVARALAIREAVPDAVLVGVFTAGPTPAVAATARRVGLDMVQWHRPVDPVAVRNLREQLARPLLLLAAPRPRPELAPRAWLFDLPKGAPADPAAQRELWRRAAAARRAGLPVMLAGGLEPGNVGAAVAAAAPAVVDVSRGVEREPGVKSARLVERFLEEVRRARHR